VHVSDQDDQSLAAKLDHLFRTVHPAGRGPYTHEEVARAVRDSADASISATYVWQLRTGKRTDPRMSHLVALARVFDVDPAYFFDGELGATMRANLGALAALHDPHTRRLATAAGQLTASSRSLLDDVTTHLLVLENRAAPA
jgi:transcriptional regulator with XRE-family HTH domain